jgi:NADP-dependent 3-hydroxy acid dehydrogenase YdfG
MSKVWLITGCSTGFGRELAKEALQAGNKVVVTARKAEAVKDIVDGYTDTALAVQLDVTNTNEIATAVEQCMKSLDVLMYW